MADRMAYWVECDWAILTEADLNSYTFSVAGAVGLLICDIWTWFDGTQVDRLAAIHFGRGLQSVNILRNREEDIQRGVHFFPTGWDEKQMFDYAAPEPGPGEREFSSPSGIKLSGKWWKFPWPWQKRRWWRWRTAKPSSPARKYCRSLEQDKRREKIQHEFR